MERAGLDRSAHYLVRVEGVLDRGWVAWFEGLTVTPGEHETTIAGPVRDSAALHGLLAKVRDLGLPLLQVLRVHQGPTAKEMTGDA
ncbi:MAG TPA: hypothetical protein VFA46_09550 [Actinomycetes bacterium]|nr:hypothetical protein [Actinomycetes bacterium]